MAEKEPQRRERPVQNQEVDELSLEQPRLSLLDILDKQLRSSESVSRLLFLFQVDDKRQAEIIQAFTSWRKNAPEVTGVLAFIGGNMGLHFLEGPTPKLYAALQFFNTFNEETLEKSGAPILCNLRILYLGELYKNRASIHWCSFAYTASKANAGALGGDTTDPECVFHAYKTILVASMKVKDQVVSRDEDIDFNTFQDSAPPLYRALGDTLVAQEDLVNLCSKDCESLFDYREFEELFILPPQLRLESDNLWPMPPPPVY